MSIATSLAPGVFTDSDRRLGRKRVSATEAIMRFKSATSADSANRRQKVSRVGDRAELLTMDGDPDRIRTCDPQIRNLMLYPTELRDHAGHI